IRETDVIEGLRQVGARMPATLFGPKDTVNRFTASAEFGVDKSDIVRELKAVLLKLGHRRLQLLWGLKFVLDLEPGIQRREQVLLASLSRVDLEAEISEPRVGEALLHNIKCRHFICN